MLPRLAANEKGFVQVGDFEFRLFDNVSQIYRFKLMFCCFDEKRSVELELKLNSSTNVDDEFRQAQLAQNPMLAVVLFKQTSSSYEYNCLKLK